LKKPDKSGNYNQANKSGREGDSLTLPAVFNFQMYRCRGNNYAANSPFRLAA
jgi:hypothetical protein